MSPAKPVATDALRRVCDPAQFSFQTTAELEEIGPAFGQERATEAIAFGIGIRRDGFNLFALGPPGIGKHALVTSFLKEHAASDPVPPDWCYVNNFRDPNKPCALKLPTGRGRAFQHDMEGLVEGLRSAIPAALQSEDYQTRRQAIEEKQKEQHEKAFREIENEGHAKSIALVRTPMGLALAPMKKGGVITPEQFEELPAREQERIKADIDLLQEKLRATLRQALKWEQEGREEIKSLNREVTSFAVDHLMGRVREKYKDVPEALAYLETVQQDILESAVAFLPMSVPGGEGGLGGLPIPPELTPEGMLKRYSVNVLVDHTETKGAPVVYEDNPSVPNLVGRIEHTSRFGTLSTDFTLIKPGALHRAAGGYLVLNARRLLQQPLAWESLKAALRAHHIRIESLAERLSLITTISLEPEPIPLDVKVVLLGERVLYYLLSGLDPDFKELFKVAADFEEQLPRSTEVTADYARLIGSMAREEKLRPLSKEAVARTIEQSARLAHDSEKLSAHREGLLDLLREADYWASQDGDGPLQPQHIQKAIDMQIRRSDRIRSRIYEEILRGTLLIDVTGAKVGQINGLSVAQVGGFAFGAPSRITARVRLGKGEVVDIEREVEMGGPIHSKGVMILTGFLAARYALDYPLSLSASLVFEQNYGGVEGDSASAAETCALLSALSDVPLRQDLAVTGSVNQHGEVQAIGGVNEKIEGFFDVCKARGLTDQQGVVIPASNVKHLMLRPDVVEAVQAGKFTVYEAATVDDVLELLTGTPAGERDKDGLFPEGSVNRLVEDRLILLAELAKERLPEVETGGGFPAPSGGGGGASSEPEEEGSKP